MHEEFWWQAAQAIEKLLKAGLICNDVSVRKYGHNIVKLWEKHLETFSDLAVYRLPKPDELGDDFWTEKSLEHFVSTVNKLGNPDTRYGLIGHYEDVDDLFILDLFISELRRRAIGLDWIVGADWKEDELKSFYGQPYRNVIREFPKLQIPALRPPEGRFETVGPELADVLFSWNFAFQRSKEDLSKKGPVSVGPQFGGFRNSYLYLHWESLKKNPKDPKLKEQTIWLLDKIKLDKDTQNEFIKLMNIDAAP